MKLIAPLVALAGVAYAQSSCSWQGNNPLFKAFNVWIDQNCFTEALGYCSGFLDNFRGQCGPITNWQASADGIGSRFYFNVDEFHPPACVENAVYLASNPHITGMECHVT